MPAETIDTDICIVGAGVAGLFAASSLPSGLDVVVVDQGTVGQGSSPFAQGGMAAAMAPDDSPALHLADTVAAGAGLVDRVAAGVLCAEAPDRVRELVAMGCRFDANADGTLHLAREGAQSVPRSVHTADATGAELVRALRAAAKPRVRRLEAHAFALAVLDGRCWGVHALADREPATVRAKATLLATGGAGALFASTTNPPASVGSAIALAEGTARLMDLELVQFHPTALAVPESPRPLLTEALRGAGAHLLDADGHRFMPEVHPDAELAPRHVVTAAIIERGGAFLDARHLGTERLEEEFPTVLASCRSRGFDLASEPVPVTPAAHYLIGGVATGLDGRTTLPGLFAAGEAAATGVHGANRMAGNSLSEAVVFGRRAALAMAQDAAGSDEPPELPGPKTPPARSGAIEGDLRDRVVQAVTRGAGPVREAEGGRSALADLTALADETSAAGAGPELAAMVRVGHLMVRSALAREETRGVHHRRDHPQPDADWEGIHLSW